MHFGYMTIIISVFRPVLSRIQVSAKKSRRNAILIYHSMPYSKNQFFSIQTPGFAELVPDSELFLMFSNGFTAKFEFKGDVDIGAIGRMISEYFLE